MIKKLFLITILLTNIYALTEDTKFILDAMDKKFEQMDKKFEQVDNRFEQMDKKFDKRFDLMQQQIDRRFEQSDRRFDMLVYILVGGFTLIMGYLLKERNSIKNEIQKEFEPQLIKKADKNILDEVVSVIEEMAKNDKVMQNILKKHHFKIES